MPLILPGNVASATASTGFNVDNSCRFNRGDSPYLSRTQSTSPTHDDKCTMSFWFKQGSQAVTASRGFSFGGSDDTSNRSHFYIETDGQLYSYGKLSNSVHLTMNSTRMLRDSGAWYHYCLAVDTTQGTEANRVREYINNEEITSYVETTYPSQNDNFPLVKGSRMLIGAIRGGSDQIYNHAECYLAEVHFIDGQQLTPSSFAEYDEDSPTIWKPKDCKADLTYGTNGFYLDFGDSADLGADVSGNSNDFTATNLDATDQATDTPTNNFCTWNPLIHAATTGVFSEGNCKISPASNTSRIYTASTLAMPVKSGSKWYAEFKIDADNEGSLVGVMDASFIADAFNSNPDIDSNTTRTDLGRVVYRISTGDINYPNGQAINTGVTAVDNDIISVALDAGGGLVYFAKNGTWLNSADPAAGSNGADVTGQGWWTTGVDEFVFICGDGSVNAFDNWEAHFGGCPAFAITSGNADADGYGNFEYAVPSGFYALCTKNLAEYG